LSVARVLERYCSKWEHIQGEPICQVFFAELSHFIYSPEVAWPPRSSKRKALLE